MLVAPDAIADASPLDESSIATQSEARTPAVSVHVRADERFSASTNYWAIQIGSLSMRVPSMSPRTAARREVTG